ncbi:MAG: glycosyltransferase family 2 protein [Gemmatimonas sp.]
MPAVSIITPTFARAKFHERIAACVRAQSFRDIEWLVLDDSPEPSPVLRNAGGIVKYRHTTEKLSVGEKRNRLVAEAAGDIVVHFDDDDFYAPHYVETVVSALANESLDLLNLRGFFVLDERAGFLGYWNLLHKGGLHFKCSPQGVELVSFSEGALDKNHLGWGFGFAYRKAVWDAIKFPHVNWNEDGQFSLAAQDRFRCDGIVDVSGLALHVVHRQNSSTCFAQFNLPPFMLGMVFPGYRSVE